MNYRNTNPKNYKHYISNIAFRFGFEIEETDDGIYKILDDKKILLTEGVNANRRWWKAWRKLSDEYGYCGIWKDKD